MATITMGTTNSISKLFVILSTFITTVQAVNGIISCPEKCTCSRGTVTTTTLEIHCSGKGLTELPTELPYASSYRLIFAHNDIAVLDSRSYLDKTAYLDLSYNRIYRLTEKAIKELAGRVRYLHLDNNNLTCLPLAVNTEDVMASVNEVTLHNNPWNCSCLDTILHKWIEDDHRQVVDTHSLRCYDQNQPSMIHNHGDDFHQGKHGLESEAGEKDTTDTHTQDTHRVWCDLPKVKDSKLSQRQGFLAFLMTLTSIGVIFAGLGVLYLYKYWLKQKEKKAMQRQEHDDTRTMITNI